jgi:hypothetical protein
MSAPGNAGRPDGDSADYFSRRVSRDTPWTADLVTVDMDEEETQHRSDDRARSPALLSPVQSDLLSPATLSPPAETTETSPLLDSSQYGHSYASTSTPVVCCRAGGRPADVPPPTNNAHIFPTNGPPQDMGGQPLWYRSYALREFERNKPFPSRRHAQKRACCGSKYFHRWVLALGLLATLALIQPLILCVFPSDSSTAHDWNPFNRSYSSETFTHSFDKVESFSLVDKIRSQYAVKGTVSIEPAPQEQTADIIATVSFAASTKFHVSSPNWKRTDSSLYLQLPIFSQTPHRSRHARSHLSVAVALYLNPGVSLTSLNIDSTHLAIKGSKMLFGPVRSAYEPTINTTEFTTQSTPIDLSYWTSRHTILKTSSSPITGSFTLLDLLSLHSSSGQIKVSVNTDEADSSNPQPAQLSVSTSSGSVQVDTGLLTVHDREYRTDVSTQSGSITGTFLLGSLARFTSSSGSINADVIPYDSQAPAGSSSLYTRSSSGATRVNLLNAHKNGGKVFTGLRSEHVSEGSGSLTLRYSDEWEGKMAASVGSGSVNIRGRGVVVDEASQYPGGHVRAHKGEGDSVMQLQSGSGSVDVVLGGV